MIVVLHPARGAQLASDLIKSIREDVPEVQSTARDVDAPGEWPGEPEWNDLLVVLFDGDGLNEPAWAFVERYLGTRSRTSPGAQELPGVVLPVAIGSGDRPPAPISGVKSMRIQLDGDAGTVAENTKLVARQAAVLLGLAPAKREQFVFVSYRSTDGATIAQQVFEDFRRRGVRAWMDCADQNLVGGDRVQERIEAQLDCTSLLVLIDTPEAKNSEWIHCEVDSACGRLLPILPIVVGPVRGTRFSQLKPLQRDVCFPDALNSSLSMADLDKIYRFFGDLVVNVQQRRRMIRFRAQQAFERHKYRWQVLSDRLSMFLGQRPPARRVGEQHVLSHCSVFEADHEPAADALRNYVLSRAPNFRLLVYGFADDILSDSELAYIYAKPSFKSLCLAHHSELDPLLASNFTSIDVT
jgi:hypothetical protein